MEREREREAGAVHATEAKTRVSEEGETKLREQGRGGVAKRNKGLQTEEGSAVPV